MLELTKGSYAVRAFVESEEAKKYISDTVKAEVGSYYDADNDGNIAVDGAIALTSPVTIANNSSAYCEADGSVRTADGRPFSATLDDFAPGAKDFAVTVTYDQIFDESEHQPHGDDAIGDPSIGYTFFSGETKIEISLFDAGAMRIFENGEQKIEQRSTMAAAGSLMGKLEWPDCFRHATVTFVKTNGWMYVVISANGNAGGIGTDGNRKTSTAETFTEFVPMMIDIANGEVYIVKGVGSKWPSYDVIGRYTSSVIPQAFENVTSAFFHFFYGDGQAYVRASAYGWTTDEQVLADFDAKFKSTFSITTSEPIDTLTVNGEAYAGKEILTVHQTRTIAFTIPEGKVVDYITVNGEKVLFAQENTMISLTVSTENNNLGPKDVNVVLKAGSYVNETVFTGSVSVGGTFSGKDSLETVFVRFISPDGAVVKGRYDAATKTYTATVPKGQWTAYASNGYIMGTTLVASGNATTVNQDIKLVDYVTKDSVAVSEKGLAYNAADGSYDINKNVGYEQENAINNISFRPDSEILEFGFTLTGMTKRAAAGGYPFMGMFVRDSAGGMMRIAWAEAGDELRMMSADHWKSRVALTEKVGTGLGGVQGWVPFGVPSGYYTFDKPDYKLTVKIRLDGYNLSIQFKTGNSTEWKSVEFDNGTTLQIYDYYNQDTNLALIGDGETNKRNNFVNELYELDKDCVFGISARRDVITADDNVAHFADIWYNIIEKD